MCNYCLSGTQDIAGNGILQSFEAGNFNSSASNKHFGFHLERDPILVIGDPESNRIFTPEKVIIWHNWH